MTNTKAEHDFIENLNANDNSFECVKCGFGFKDKTDFDMWRNIYSLRYSYTQDCSEERISYQVKISLSTYQVKKEIGD